MDLNTLKLKMDAQGYVYDDTMATILYVALQLGRPLLIEGAAGVGKTEIAKVMASALDRDLVRLQCYEGLDESKALYECRDDTDQHQRCPQVPDQQELGCV